MTRRLLLAAAVFFAALPSASAQPLKFQFKKGDQLTYDVESTTQMTTSFMNNDVKVNIKQTLDFSWAVNDVDSDGKAKATVKMGRIQVVIDSPKGKIVVDSKNAQEGEDAISKKVGRDVMTLAKVELTCTVSPTGEITDLKLSEETQKAIKEAGELGSAADSVSEDGLKRLILGGVILPKEDAKDWSHKLDSKSPLGKVSGTMHFALEGTVEKDGKKLHKIAIKPDLTLKPNPNPLGETKVKSFTAKGHALFDNPAGRLVEVAGTQTIDMTADMNNITISQQMNIESSMKLRK